MQLVRLFHQRHSDVPSAQYVASNQLSGFEELWVSYVSYQLGQSGGASSVDTQSRSSSGPLSSQNSRTGRKHECA